MARRVYRRANAAMGMAAALLAVFAILRGAAPESFRFVILGDRTGETQPGTYERAWREGAAEDPAFVVSVGDTIEGMNDATAEAEWQEAERVLLPYRKYSFYLAPGNHDVWSAQSERLFRKHAGHPLHYSFDYGRVHFTVLDNSRSDLLPAGEMAFLEKDLQEHAAQPVKFIVSHRPSWLVNVAFGDAQFAFHRLVKKYGVRYVIAGHLHQLLYIDLEGVAYVSMASSGGHLRLSRQYDDGWLFAHALITVDGTRVSFQIKELQPPYGQGRVSRLTDWGRAGLVDRGGAHPIN